MYHITYYRGGHITNNAYWINFTGLCDEIGGAAFHPNECETSLYFWLGYDAEDISNSWPAGEIDIVEIEKTKEF